MKKRNYTVFDIIILIIGLCMMFLGTHEASVARYKAFQERCKRTELIVAVHKLLDIIEHDQNDYVLDVLCETDEWCEVDSLLAE